MSLQTLLSSNLRLSAFKTKFHSSSALNLLQIRNFSYGSTFGKLQSTNFIKSSSSSSSFEVNSHSNLPSSSKSLRSRSNTKRFFSNIQSSNSDILNTHISSLSRDVGKGTLAIGSSSEDSKRLIQEIYKQFIVFVRRHFSTQPRGWEHFPNPEGNKEAKEANTQQKTDAPKEKESSNQQDVKDNKTENKDSGSNNNSEKKNEDGSGGFNMSMREIIGLSAIAAVIFVLLSDFTYSPLTWQEFQNEYLSQKKVKEIRVNAHRDKATITLHTEGLHRTLFIGSSKNLERKLEDYRKELGLTPEQFLEYGRVQYEPEATIWSDFGGFFFSIMITGTIIYLITKASLAAAGGGKGGGMRGLFSIGKSNAKLFTKTDKVTTKFNDVAGLPEAKQEVQEFVDFLKHQRSTKSLVLRYQRVLYLLDHLVLERHCSLRQLLEKRLYHSSVPLDRTSLRCSSELDPQEFVTCSSKRVITLLALYS